MQSPLQLVLRGAVAAAVLGSLAACEETPVESPPPQTEMLAAVRSQTDYYGSTELYVLHADGTNVVQITQGMDAKRPVWSPDGRRIAFLSQSWDKRGLYTIDADGTNLQRISEGAFSPAWSPDGSRIAVGGLTAGGSGIYVMRADGTELRQLRACNCASPAWSPDGLRIAFYDATPHDQWDPTIYVMRADGSEPIALSTGLYASIDPTWSPDGEWIAFAGQREMRIPGHDIYMMRPDGTELRRITETPGYSDWELSFSPDGSRLVFGSYSYESAVSQLYEVSIDGQKRIQITTSPGSYASPAWRP